jgi:penicillin-binding protein 2
MPVLCAAGLVVSVRGQEVRRAEPIDDIPVPSAVLVEPAKPAARQLDLNAVPVPRKTLPPPAPVAPPPKAELKAGWQTQKEARTFTLSVPAPRGQITDRHGVPLAQCRVVQYLALNFPYFGENAPDSKVLEYAAQRVTEANRVLRKSWNLTQERVLQHYKNRRWLPLVFSVTGGINEELSSEQQQRLKPLLQPGSGLMLQPAYLRVYPKGAFAAHIIGYTHKTRPLPLGPIQDGDVMFEEQEGAYGLEMSFDRDLQGRPGLINVLFNPDGTKLKEEVLRRPLPGNNVVTTIDYDFQKYAEEALAKHTTGGAMVVLNIRTGEILAMASYPLFDPNLFVPSPTAKVYQRLLADKTMPLFPRAYQGEYPPASTFKVIVALAGLEGGAITPRTAFDCVSAFTVGDRVFHNWNKEGEGEMNVVSAIKRSCNTWFYQAGLATGGGPITNMAVRMGFGERTGVPLAERPGFVPTDSWMQQHLGHKNIGGDVANLSIGQGRTLVTPLQAAQCMAALADGTVMPQLRLVMQIQDLNDRVLQAFSPAVRRRVELKPIAHDPVVKGMIAVVNGEAGTGQAAALDDKYHCQLAGKTGTAQWKPNEERRLAWFTGFLPANDPLYAYAVVYEGEPGEEISGGKKAAPIVNEVFTNVLKTNSPDEPLVLLAQNKDSTKVVAVTQEDEQSDGVAKSESVSLPAPPPLPPQTTEERRGVTGFFHRLFGK